MPNSTQGHPDSQGKLFPTLEEARTSNKDRAEALADAKKTRRKPQPNQPGSKPKKKR